MIGMGITGRDLPSPAKKGWTNCLLVTPQAGFSFSRKTWISDVDNTPL